MIQSDKERLKKIKQSWEKLNKEISERNISKEDILNDTFIQWAVTTPIYNIGEQVSHLSNEIKQQHDDIPWNKISGLRNRLVHDYEGINWIFIVEVIFTDLPEFISKIDEIINN